MTPTRFNQRGRQIIFYDYQGIKVIFCHFTTIHVVPSCYIHTYNRARGIYTKFPFFIFIPLKYIFPGKQYKPPH